MASTADARTPDAASGQLPSQRLGKYRIERQLGAGGMGTVFLAVDSELRRTVALKVLPKERAANPQLVRRFKAEGQAAARLEHNNIVKVFEAGEIDGHLYIALEYIDGIDVQELVRKRGLLPVRRSIEIVTQVAEALQHAYERGIVHRDIKPSNLLIRKDGLVKLADMGLARAIDETTDAGITHAGMTVGTVDYISPEQGSNSKQADIRSDLYSLGCSWYHMLTGEVPYPEGTAKERLIAHATASIPNPRRLNERIPGAVVAVLQRLMAKRPEDRYQTPRELIDDLKQPSLLRHETGVADIAGLALSDSESFPLAAADSDDAIEAPRTGDVPPGARSRSKPPQRGRKPERSATSPASKPNGQSQRNPAARDGKATRELPPRSERPEQFAVSHSMIDPDTIKIAGFGLLVFVVVSAIGWGIWRSAQDQLGDLTPSSVNPLAPPPSADASPSPPPVVSTAPPTQSAVEPPAPSITEFQPDAPFPGIGSAPADAGVTDVPRWVYEARARVVPQPQIAIVDPATVGGLPTAADALAQLPAAGGVIEFRGPGPHSIADLAIADGQEVVMRAAAGDAPVLKWTDTAAADVGRMTVRGGRLELQGLHIVASGRGRDAARPLIAADSATVVIRNCSITLADPAAAAVPAVQLTRSTSGPSRCVLENVIVRGNNLTVAAIAGPGHELVAGNCVFATGDAPAISVVEPAASGVDASHAESAVQLLASVVVSRNSVFAGEQRDASSPPAVALRVRHTALIGEGAAAATLRLDPWPEGQADVLDQPRALGVKLVCERSLWIGWSHLTAFQNAAGGNPVLVDGDAQWLQFWRTPVGGGSAVLPVATVTELDHQRADPASVVALLSATTDSANAETVTLDSAALPDLPEFRVARIVADSARPRAPQNLDAAFTGQVVTIDLAKKGLTLNRLLNGPECPDGAHVVLTGRKRVVIEPVLMQGKSLKIEFDGGDEPLVVEPAPRSGVDRPPALFRVEQGRLDLINARLRIPASETSSFPLRLLQVVDGSFSVRRCILYGQVGAGSQDVPTIEWLPGNGDATRFGLIEDTLIVGRSQAVGGQLHGQLLDVSNSIVVSEGDCFRLTGGESDTSATVHLADCTLSAAAAFFRIESSSEGGVAGRLQVFVDQTVYGPPLAESGGPVLLVQQSRGDQTPLVDWWEDRSAISDRINRFRVADAGRTSPQDFNDAWVRGWGPEHINDDVFGPLAVILAARQVEPAKAQPSDFRLDSKSIAATAGPAGGPLGAAIETVGPRDVREPTPTTPAPATATPNAPGTPRPRRPNF